MRFGTLSPKLKPCIDMAKTQILNLKIYEKINLTFYTDFVQIVEVLITYQKNMAVN